MKFTKMQGCGNDYVYVNGFTEKLSPEEKPEIVRKLSDRHFGIGGDGVIFINPAEEADFEMEMYNADGSRSEMCGNGIRCVAKICLRQGTDGQEGHYHCQRRKNKISETHRGGKDRHGQRTGDAGTGEHGKAHPCSGRGAGNSGSHTGDGRRTGGSECSHHGRRHGIPHDMCIHGQSPCHRIYGRGKGS